MCVGGILAAEIFNKLNIADNDLCLFSLILALFKVCICKFFPNIEKVKIIKMPRVPKERTPSYKMGDALDSWVDLAKECSPVRCDDNIDHMVITNPPVIKLVVNITSPAVIKQVIITNKPSVLQVATAFW